MKKFTILSFLIMIALVGARIPVAAQNHKPDDIIGVWLNEEWSGGTIYDPKNGKTYKCFIRFENQNKLKIRGFIGISVLGRNTYWTRSTHQP